MGRINLDEYQVPVYREVLGVGGHGNVCTTIDADQLVRGLLKIAQTTVTVEDPWFS